MVTGRDLTCTFKLVRKIAKTHLAFNLLSQLTEMKILEDLSDRDMIGTMTSGGTESLILAVLAYRGYARETRGVTRPNIVMPVTGHVGVDKAGHLLGTPSLELLCNGLE